MVRKPTLTYDRGTLILHPPPKGKDWLDYATWDDRVERFRVPAIAYRSLLTATQITDPRLVDQAKSYEALELTPSLQMEPYRHQQEALDAWQENRRGLWFYRPLQARPIWPNW